MLEALLHSSGRADTTVYCPGTSMSEIAVYNGIENCFGTIEDGDYIYTIEKNIFTRLNKSDLTLAAGTNNLNFINNAYSLTKSGDYIFATEGKIISVDVSNSLDMTIGHILDSSTTGTEAGSSISGNHLFIVTQSKNNIVSIDITNPLAMYQSGVLADSTNLNGAVNIAISGNIAFVTCRLGNSLTAVDIGDPTNMSIISRLNDTIDLGSARGLAIYGNHAFVGLDNGSGKIIAVNISNSSAMSITSILINSSFSEIWSIAISGKIAYSNGPDGGSNLASTNISDPANMVFIEEFDDGKGSEFVITDDEFVYVSSDDERLVRKIGICNDV